MISWIIVFSEFFDIVGLVILLYVFSVFEGHFREQGKLLFRVVSSSLATMGSIWMGCESTQVCLNMSNLPSSNY